LKQPANNLLIALTFVLEQNERIRKSIMMSRMFQGYQRKDKQFAQQRRSSSFSSSHSATVAPGRTAASWTREMERRMREWGVDQS
jgi:hypothetical protein